MFRNNFFLRKINSIWITVTEYLLQKLHVLPELWVHLWQLWLCECKTVLHTIILSVSCMRIYARTLTSTHTHWHPITERHEASHLLITGHMYDKQSRWTVAFSSLTGKKKIWRRWLDGAVNWILFTVKCLFFLCMAFVDEWIPFRKLLFYDYSLKYPKADTLLPDCLSLSASDFDQMDLSHMTALKLNEKHSVLSHQLYLLTSPLTVAWVNFLYGINLNS